MFDNGTNVQGPYNKNGKSGFNILLNKNVCRYIFYKKNHADQVAKTNVWRQISKEVNAT